MATDGKQKIIDAAKEVICRGGIAGATMRGIAEEAGLSTGAIYHYYKSKEEILYDVMDESLSVSSRIAEKSRNSESSPQNIIDEICINIVDRFKKNHENCTQFYLAQEAMLGDEELKIKFKGKYQEWINKTNDLISYLYDRPSGRYDKALASLLIGAIDGVVLQLLLDANQAEIDDIAKVYRLLLTKGLPTFLEELEHI